MPEMLRCHHHSLPNAHRLVGDPIDAVSGANTEITRDFRLTGAIPLDWRRHYDSSRAGMYFALGWGHSHEYERALHFDADGLRYVGPLGYAVPFPPLMVDGAAVLSAGLTLRRLTAMHYAVDEPGRPTMEFVFTDPLRPAPLRALVQGDARVAFWHRADGALAGITDSAGRAVAVQSDDYGRVTRLAIVDAAGQVVRELVAYSYDEAGNLVAGSDAYRHAFSFAYDAANRMVQRTDQRGYSFYFAYDEWGRCVHSRGEDGLYEVHLEYRPDEKRTLVTQADGGVWEYQYDDAGLLTVVVDPYGGERTYVNDDTGNVVEEIDPNGSVITWVYDSYGRLLGKRSALGHFSSDARGPLGPDQLAHRVPNCSAEWEYGDLSSSRQFHSPIRVEASDAAVPHALRRLIRSVSDRAPSALATDQDGTRNEPRTFTNEVHDELGTLIRETGPDGRTRHWTYDAGGNAVRFHDFDGALFECEYHSWDLLGRRTDPLGRTLTRRYSTSARLIEEIDAVGVSSAYVYDLNGRTVEFWYAGACVERYRYDDGGNLIAKLDGNGRPIIEQEFGPDNLRTVRRLASGETHRFEYTDRGHYAGLTTDDIQVTFDYDAFSNRILDERDGRGVSHKFRGFRQLERTTVLDRFTTRYKVLSDTAIEIHDPGGHAHLLAFPGNGIVARRMSSGLAEATRYDRAGRCIARASSRVGEFGSEAAWVRQFSYSGEGDLLATHDSSAGSTHFEYDAAHRLRHVTSAQGAVRSFRHDAADNLIEQPGLAGVSIGHGNRLLAANGEVFEYDERGNLATRVGARGVIQYRYDSRNMLVACTSPRGEWCAAYDPLGRRTRESVGESWREFYWDTDRLVAEVRSEGRLRVYVYADAFAIVPLLWLDYDSAEADLSKGRRYFPICDQLGTPVRVENSIGEVVWRARVSPYGSVTVLGEPQLDVPLRFPGHHHDAETGLHYNRFRYYSPELGRYLQPDPLGTAVGSNLYAYSANPLKQVDVRGLCPDGPAAPPPAPPPPPTEAGEAPAPPATNGRPELPPFDGVTTHGVLITNEGAVVPLVSGDKDPKYRNYPSAGHADGKAAIYIRENGSSGGVFYHNNTDGTCGYCDKQIPTLLPEGATLRVVPPEGAKANNSMAKDQPTDYTGNANAPKPPKPPKAKDNTDEG